MRAGGFEPEDYETDDIEVWPENHASFLLFQKVRTQWVYASTMAGAAPVGLNYCAIHPFIERMALDDDEYDDIWLDLQAMEAAALEAMRADK